MMLIVKVVIGTFICLGAIGLIMEHNEDNRYKGDE